MSIFETLKGRNLVHQTTFEYLDPSEVTGVYSGFDPSAPSLHVGNLLPIITLARFAAEGHHAFALIGGATAQIGDPSGKSKERTLLDEETVKKNTAAIADQISWVFRRLKLAHKLSLPDNSQWFNQMGCLEFLRDVGKNFTVNYMLAKDSVATRLENGLSFTEFSYMLLQAHDFRTLATQEDVNLQIGGSDQWGNIVAGIDLCKDKQLYGLTLPLLLNSNGTKFGKTAEGAVYLSPKLTSIFNFRQFWYNTPDSELATRLLQFTFFSPKQIEEICQDPKQAQQTLADEMVRIVHGPAAVGLVNIIGEVLYGSKELSELSGELQQAIIDDLEKVKITRKSLESPVQLVSDVFYHGEKRGQSKKDLEAGSISFNKKKLSLTDDLSWINLIKNKYGFLRRGRAGVCFEVVE